MPFGQHKVWRDSIPGGRDFMPEYLAHNVNYVNFNIIHDAFNIILFLHNYLKVQVVSASTVYSDAESA